MPAGRPSKYQPAYAEEVVTFCAQGYSLTAFAGSIDVARSTINEWADEHPEFSEAVSRAKNKRALWWEDRAREVAANGGPGGQATMVIFGLKNHAPEDYAEIVRQEHSGPGGKAIEISVDERRKAARELIDSAFAEVTEVTWRPGAEVTWRPDHDGDLWPEEPCASIDRAVAEAIKRDDPA
jgi:hypothetical protein